MAGLLEEEGAREAVLEGLVASIGGLDGSLAQAASSALLSWLKPHSGRVSGSREMPSDIPSQYFCRTLAVWILKYSNICEQMFDAHTLCSISVGVVMLGLWGRGCAWKLQLYPCACLAI